MASLSFRQTGAVAPGIGGARLCAVRYGFQDRAAFRLRGPQGCPMVLSEGEFARLTQGRDRVPEPDRKFPPGRRAVARNQLRFSCSQRPLFPPLADSLPFAERPGALRGTSVWRLQITVFACGQADYVSDRRRRPRRTGMGGFVARRTCARGCRVLEQASVARPKSLALSDALNWEPVPENKKSPPGP